MAGYSPLAFETITDPKALEVFNRASAYLADVYTMLHARPREGSRAGGCNLTSVLVLLTVVDALSIYVYPKRTAGDPCVECGRGPPSDNAKKRFTPFIGR